MDRPPNAEDGQSRGWPAWPRAACGRLRRPLRPACLFRRGPCPQIGIEAARHFGAAQHHRPAAQQARGDGPVKCLGRGGIGHARCDHARYQAMFGNGGQHGIGEQLLYLARFLTRHQQPEIAGEVHLADNVPAKIASADGDAVRVGGADRGERGVLLANAHMCSCSAARRAHTGPPQVFDLRS